jgi:SEC-C motif-containing protein
MRSRYTAYACGNEAYLLATWHVSTRPPTLALHQQNALRGLGLKIVRTELGGNTNDHGIVEFIARFRIDGKGFRLHEISRFVKEQDRWYYVDGDIVNM